MKIPSTTTEISFLKKDVDLRIGEIDATIEQLNALKDDTKEEREQLTITIEYLNTTKGSLTVAKNAFISGAFYDGREKGYSGVIKKVIDKIDELLEKLDLLKNKMTTLIGQVYININKLSDAKKKYKILYKNLDDAYNDLIAKQEAAKKAKQRKSVVNKPIQQTTINNATSIINKASPNLNTVYNTRKVNNTLQ